MEEKKLQDKKIKVRSYKALLDLEIDKNIINSPNNNHSQNYTPYRPFNKSNEGRIIGFGKLYFSFNKTNLDIRNPNPLGGPNRTNSSNIPSGQYKNITSHNITDEFGEVALRDKDNKVINTLLNRWTPNNKYLDSKDWEDKFNQF